MSAAREIIALRYPGDSLADCLGCADIILEALTAAGFSIVHKDEIHAPSVEREAVENADGLPFLVQYRRKDVGINWVNMAAFDVEGAADRYCQSCAQLASPWEYRVALRELMKEAAK